MYTVLVVDDSPVDRRLVAGLLEQCGNLNIQFAANGREALERMQDQLPDLVVTDLQMPEMDGLEFVTRVRARHSGVPVILMTAHGSEALAVEALERGAASYVPKSQLADRLEDTIEQLLDVAHSDHGGKRVAEYLANAEFTFVLDNDPELIPPLVELAQKTVTDMRLCDDTERLRIGVALEEALVNALYRGNLEISTEEFDEARENLLLGKSVDPVHQKRVQAPFRDRKIHVRMRVSTEDACFVVRDEGSGFDVASLPDPAHPDNFENARGRGLVLMRSFMDEVRYNERGNEVTLVKRRDAGARSRAQESSQVVGSHPE